MQTVPLSEPHGTEAVSLCLSGSKHLHAKPERLGLPFLLSWDLQLLLQPEMGRWDLGLTSVQQQHFKEGLQSHHCIVSNQQTLLQLLKGFSLQPACSELSKSILPNLQCCSAATVTTALEHMTGSRRDYLKNKNLLQFASGLQVPEMKN